MREVFLTALLGHLLGHFYFSKDGFVPNVLKYAAVTALILAAGIPLSLRLGFFWAASVLAYAIFCRLKLNIFIRQLLFFTFLFALCFFLRDGLTARPWIANTYGLPKPPLTILTGIIFLLRPAAQLIDQFFELSGLKKSLQAFEGEQGIIIGRTFTGAGRIIGMLERTLAFILIMYNQIGAIGFLMTAKTITRFKDLERREIAEYYLIGTLLSLSVTFILGMIL